MQYITRYQKDNDGTYSVVATGVELEQSHIDLLENGYPLKAEVEVPDNKKLSIEQRKKIFAMCRDIELHWGEPVESTRKLLQTELEIMKGYKALLYWATINRNCVICGKPHADLAHYEAVGRGMNRNKMNHYDKHVLALCREHHNEQHAIGVKSFDDKYHLHDSWIKVDERLNKMLKGGE
ncbi:TPA: putative HNHc nuclease [Staphylococcus aureus]